MKRRVVSLIFFVVGLAVVVGCGAAAEPEAQGTATVEPIETEAVEVSPEVMETPTVEETPEVEETSDFGDRGSHEKSDDEEGEATMTPSVVETPSGVEMSEDLPQVDMAKTDLAERLNVVREAIEVVLVEARTWQDAGMGCPQPGMVYTQVLQDGLLIRLRVDGEEYDYHSGGTRDPFLCEQAEKGTREFGEEIVPPPSMDE